MTRLKQCGDTIVEVLIAITVVSVILTGAFVSTQQSLLGTRKSQERAEALKVAELQLEHLKELISRPGNGPTDPSVVNDTACITRTYTWQPVTNIYPVTSEVFSNTSYHPATCTLTPATGLGTYTPGGGVEYYPAIRRINSGGKYTYEVIIHWIAVGGRGNQELILYYRAFT